MLRIRLTRVGKKKQPAYRLVVADARAPRDGRHVEIVGHFNPLTDPPTIRVDEERTRYWLRQGAQPSEAVAKLLVRSGLTPAPAGTREPATPPKKPRRGASRSVPAEVSPDVPAGETSAEG